MIILLMVIYLSSLYSFESMPSGVASWYSTAECGPVTASGEQLEDNAYTCASNYAAFGDILLVVSEHGAVLVRCNDRGPFVDGRVGDLTKRAFGAIGKLGDGLKQVTVWRVKHE